MWKREVAFFLPALGVIALDQLSKLWIRANLPLGHSLPQDAPVRLTHTVNPGAVFGLAFHPILLFLLILGLLGLLLFFSRHPRLGEMSWVLGIIFGGGVGNLIDRLRQGYVTDFIDLRVWPVFNLADAAIVIGASLILFFAWRRGI